MTEQDLLNEVNHYLREYEATYPALCGVTNITTADLEEVELRIVSKATPFMKPTGKVAELMNLITHWTRPRLPS